MARARLTVRVTARVRRQTPGHTRLRNARLRCWAQTRDDGFSDVSALEIHLLGKPRVSRDGEVVPHPRGHKVWGLLAYLLRTDRAPSRAELVSLLFGEADDPFAALRWNLSALRRLLGDATLEGDPLQLSLPHGRSSTSRR